MKGDSQNKQTYGKRALIIAAVLQRVKSASVTVDGNLISSIGKGILVFVGVGKEDTPNEVEKMAGKVLTMQLWDDDEGGKVRTPCAVLADFFTNFTPSGRRT